MKKIGNLIFTLILMGIVLLVYFNIDSISTFFSNYLIRNQKIIIKETNEYKRDYNYITFNTNEDYIPYTKEKIKNIYFNIINNGWTTFTFYCPKEYQECLSDVESIGNNEELMSKINDYVNPFNSFSEIDTLISSNGEIIVNVTHKYTTDKTNEINEIIDNQLENLDLKNKNPNEQITLIHNYIINNAEYDIDAAENRYSPYDSTSSYGALIERHAICSGYSDAMAIFLDKLNIPNIKISSENHVWNLVFIDNKWLHIDLTWDDVEIERYKNNYFLITTEKLLEQDTKEHNFDKSFFLEAA